MGVRPNPVIVLWFCEKYRFGRADCVSDVWFPRDVRQSRSCAKRSYVARGRVRGGEWTRTRVGRFEQPDSETCPKQVETSRGDSFFSSPEFSLNVALFDDSRIIFHVLRTRTVRHIGLHAEYRCTFYLIRYTWTILTGVV